MNYAAFRAILTLSAQDNASRTINAAIGNAQTKMARFGANAQNMGRDMMTGGGIIAAPFMFATKAAIDFENAFTGVTKTWRGTTEQLENTRKGILAMSRSAQNTATANELSAIAEQAGQLGVQSKNVLSFTRTIADLKATTNLADEAAPQFAKFANITRMPQERFSNLASTVVELGNNMATTEADIVNFGMRIAGAGAQVNIPQAKIMGLAAGLSSVGLEAEAGGTAISKTLIDLSNRVKTGGAGLAEVAKISGMSGAQFAKAFQQDAAGATVSFIEGLGKIKQEGGNVFQTLDKLEMGEIRLRDTLLRASGAGDLLRNSLNLSSTAWEQNTALTTEASLRYKTTDSQIKIFRNNVTALAITVGNAIIPALSSMVYSIQSLTSWVADASDKYPTLTKTIVIGTAALSAFLFVAGGAVYTIGTISKVIAGLTAAYTWLTTSTTASTIAQYAKTLATNIATVAEMAFWVTIVGVGAAVGALGVGLLWLANKTGIATAAQWLLNMAMDANPIGAVIIAVAGLTAAVVAMIVYWKELSGWFESIPTWAKVAVIAISAIAAPMLLVAAGIAWVVNNWTTLTASISAGATAVARFFVGMQNTAFGALSSIWTFVSSLSGRMFEAGRNIATSIADGIKSAISYPLDAINSVVSGIRDFLPFSPAKVGPLRDIHRVKIVETIADGMKPAPMVNAMQSVVGATVGVSGPGMNPARSGGGSVVVNFAPTVNVTGTGAAEDIRAQIMAMGPEMVAYLKRALAREMAGGFA